MKKRKEAYYNKHFETSWNNIKNTSKGIKPLVSLKTVASSAPTVLSRDIGNTMTNPCETAKGSSIKHVCREGGCLTKRVYRYIVLVTLFFC